MSEKLLPCPFCGSSAHYGRSFKISTDVFCDGCCAIMPSVDKWNRRPTPDAKDVPSEDQIYKCLALEATKDFLIEIQTTSTEILRKYAQAIHKLLLTGQKGEA